MSVVESLRIVQAGLERFYGEGYVRWPRNKFEAIFPPGLSLDEPAVAEQLADWERRGFIKLNHTGDPFVTVLRPEP